MIGYKLFHKRKDGSYGPLFINRKQRLLLQNYYKAEDHPTKGYAHRPGWHLCKKAVAPHLSTKGRVWVKVWYDPDTAETFKRPDSQGGEWILAKEIRLLSEV